MLITWSQIYALLCAEDLPRLFILDFWKFITRLLPKFLIFFPEISGYSLVICYGHTKKPRDFGDYTSMWGASVCSCFGNLTSAIIYYHVLSKTNNVESGDFNRSSVPWIIFQCTLSKLKLFSQSCHFRTFRNIVTLCPNSTFLDFVSVFSFFVRILMIALKLIFVMSMICGGRLILQGPLLIRKIAQTCSF